MPPCAAGINCLHDANLLPNADETETCVIAAPWWGQGWGAETFSNRLFPCCDKQMVSNYSVATLRHKFWWANETWARGQPMRLAFASAAIDTLGGAAAPADPGPGISALARSSGGNALLTALTACRQVSLYGAGLLRLPVAAPAHASTGTTSAGTGTTTATEGRRASHQLVYAHYYDPRVGHCMTNASMVERHRADCARRAARHERTRRFRADKGAGRKDERCEPRGRQWRRDRIETELLLHVLHVLGVVQWIQ